MIDIFSLIVNKNIGIGKAKSLLIKAVQEVLLSTRNSETSQPKIKGVSHFK